MEYKPFLIQKLQSGSPVRDSKEWGLWVKHVPFKIFPELKDLPSYSWPDEQGDDEFVPSTPYYKAYTMGCDFVYIGRQANAMIQSFLVYLANGGEFRIYDTYTGVGRENVRYVKYSEDILYRRENTDNIVVFSVTFKVNNPIDNIILSK